MALQLHLSFDEPLGVYPSIHGDSLILPYTTDDDDACKGRCGLANIDLATGAITKDELPLFVDHEEFYMSELEWQLHGEIAGRLVFSLSWEDSYERRYRIMQFDGAGWFELPGDETNHVVINPTTPFTAMTDMIEFDGESSCFEGGGLLCYRRGEDLGLIVDCTHAFDRDSSDAGMTSPEFETIRDSGTEGSSNLEFVGLEAYREEHELPADIPADHPIHDPANVFEFLIAKHGERTFMFFNDFNGGGITDILVFG